MVSVDNLIDKADAIERDNPSYKLGHSGDDGYCDCIGLLIGAIRRAGGSWSGTHGSNYAARSEVEKLLTINNASQLQRGMAIFKGKEDTSNLPGKYNTGGSSYNGDLHDYYHVGIVRNVSPLDIMHCTTGNGKDILHDTKLGKWGFAGKLKKVSYEGESGAATKMNTYMVTADGGVNFRRNPSKQADKICKIPEGETVEGKPYNASWLSATYKGTSGYLMTEFVTEWEDATNIDDTSDDSSDDVYAMIKNLEKRIDALEKTVSASIGLG